MKKTHPLTPYFFEDKPMFGLDIGHSTVRVMQLTGGKKCRVIGYGEISFDESAIQNGIVVKHEVIAEAVQKLFKHSLVGDITTKRVAMSLPIARAFTRSIDLPKLNEKELAEAVKTEVEQYIPAAADDLYVDYSVVARGKTHITVFIVAMPRTIVDSHLTLSRLLGLETVLIETTSSAGAALFARDAHSDLPAVLVDFGSDSADITIYDKGPIVSGTVACGGQQITQLIADALGVSEREAVIIKTKYGLALSKKQKQIEAAIEQPLSLLVREVRRTIRYYEERSKSKRSISQVVVMGGGANMPGLTDYLTSSLRIPVRAFDPTIYLDFGHLQPVSIGDRMSYVTSAGLSLHNPREVF
ncbi:MAG: type IV pilus assembly protein PilM [Candidatus Saccharimonadales bacterium]